LPFKVEESYGTNLTQKNNLLTNAKAKRFERVMRDHFIANKA